MKEVSIRSTKPTDLYLALMRRCLLRLSENGPFSPSTNSRVVDPQAVREGKDYYDDSETMVGEQRLDNIRSLVEDVLDRGVAGDLLEAGVWRGGAAIFMRAVLAAHGATGRCVWLADSFEGLPKPDPDRYPSDAGDVHWTRTELHVSLDEVKENFRRYGLLDEQVKFLAGWFKDTLFGAPIHRLALLRVDGDMYESTWQTLEALYPRLSCGGYCVVDDYGALRRCRDAVEDFRRENLIEAPLVKIDWTGVYWKKAPIEEEVGR